jgi:hypothetical protein
MALPAVSSSPIDRVFRHYDHMHYTVNGVKHLLPANFRGKNATMEMREWFVEYLTYANKNIFVSYPPELREKVLQERIEKRLKDAPADPIIDAICLIVQAWVLILVIVGIQNRISRS